MNDSTDLELLRIARDLSLQNPEARAAFDELEARFLEREARPIEFEWPRVLYHQARIILGDSVLNRQGQMFGALNRKVQHAWRVWQDAYGPFTPAQGRYATECFLACFEIDDADSYTEAERRKIAMPLIHIRLDDLVYSDDVHSGFLQRGGVSTEWREPSAF